MKQSFAPNIVRQKIPANPTTSYSYSKNRDVCREDFQEYLREVFPRGCDEATENRLKRAFSLMFHNNQGE